VIEPTITVRLAALILSSLMGIGLLAWVGVQVADYFSERKR